LPKDLSPHVPRIRLWRQDRLPAIWKPEQIEAMLAAIDRTSPLGKRNFAIVLLACRLGLRTCDIRTFKLEDIRWDEAKIAVRQSKTGVPLVLPLSEEVGQALIDYLKHGRPRSQHREVFLSINAPFAPFGHSYNFHNIITDCRRLAGLRVPREGHWGMHSFRHTLATRLLECGTPLPVISDILGHRSIDSTQVYTKVDLASLRGAALDLEELPHA
jgi:integrase